MPCVLVVRLDRFRERLWWRPLCPLRPSQGGAVPGVGIGGGPGFLCQLFGVERPVFVQIKAGLLHAVRAPGTFVMGGGQVQSLKGEGET